jgi:hypothetical protein
VVVLVLEQDLGRRIGERPADAAVERAAPLLGQAEVQDFEHRPCKPAFRQSQIGGLQVHVDDALAMDVGEPCGSLKGGLPEDVPAAPAEVVGHALAAQQLHRQERKIPGQDAEVIDLDHVGMAGLREEAGLVAEARQILRVAGPARHLQRQGAPGIPSAPSGTAGADAEDERLRRPRDLSLQKDVAEQPVEMGEIEPELTHGESPSGEARAILPPETPAR